MASHVFQIEAGVLALSLVGTTDPTAWQAPGGKAADVVTIADYTTPGPGGDFSCQITSGALNASPNTTDQTTAATFCQPESVVTSVGVTSFTLDASFLQDPDVIAGLSAFLYEHDTKSCYFYLGLDGTTVAPRAVGRLRLIAGTVGGDARVTLVADISLPCDQKPDLVVGDATSHRVITGVPAVPITSMTAGTPGTYTPANATEPSTLAALTGHTPPITASPATAWTTGQYVQLPGTGTTAGGKVHWSSTAWVAGPA